MFFPAKQTHALCAAFALLAATLGAAPPFAPPTEAPSPFRRDRLPVDADSMSSLSREIETLALAASLDEAPQRRAAAQALALALALDPSNSSARRTLTAIAGGEAKPRDPERLTRAKSLVWQSHSWLSAPGAGSDANLFADLLGDIAAALDPAHPTAAALRDAGERGKWDGWVAPLAAFEERKPVVPETIAKADHEPPAQPPDPKLPSRLKPSKASIGAVLFDYREDTDGYVLGPTTVRMEAGPRENGGEENGEGEGGDGGQRLRIRISCHESMRWQVSEKIATPIGEALGEIHGVKPHRLPQGNIRLSTGKEGNYSFRRNGNDMTGPGFILANSALTGIAPDTTFIGTLDRSGEKLALPDYFWKKMATLLEGPGGRLVVPAAAEPYLTSLLVLEKPDFFIRYEVLLASSPAEAIRLCSGQPDEELAATLARFREIRDKSTTSALGSYLANSFVRKRLVEIHQAAPYHLSAKLLALQGAGARPRALEKKFLAAEIFEAIDTLHPFAAIQIWDVSRDEAAAMDAACEAARTHLDRLDRYSEMRDRELIKSADAVITELRTMTRLLRDRREMWEKSEDVERALQDFREADRNFRRILSLLTGDPLPKEEGE